MKTRQFGRAGMSERGKRMNAAALLRHMLAALNYDPAIVPAKLLHDLQRVCTNGNHKTRCTRDLVSGCANTTYQDYCPNAEMLRMLRPWMEKNFSFNTLQLHEGKSKLKIVK